MTSERASSENPQDTQVSLCYPDHCTVTYMPRPWCHISPLWSYILKETHNDCTPSVLYFPVLDIDDPSLSAHLCRALISYMTFCKGEDLPYPFAPHVLPCVSSFTELCQMYLPPSVSWPVATWIQNLVDQQGHRFLVQLMKIANFLEISGLVHLLAAFHAHTLQSHSLAHIQKLYV